MKTPHTSDMNYGAFIYKKELFNKFEMEEIEAFALGSKEYRKPLHASGNYAGLEWHKFTLNKDLPYIKKILEAIGTDSAELIDFYYLDPGASLHPHKDLTGAGLNNRIRFHMPVITNPKALFVINGEKDIFMKPGDLWCLDTSYTHAVHNGGDETRIHIVIECDITGEIRKNIPNDLKSRIHSVGYLFFLVWSLAKALLVNSVKDPKYLLIQLGMVVNFIKWRVLKIKKPK
tara:strand:+ start:503 stop:1195 length:693 start_codon:yes stop_codon:yes gene_type:complete